MAISKDDARQLLVLGERLEGDVAQLAVIDLKQSTRNRRVRELQLDHFSGLVTAVAFSQDVRFIAGVIGNVAFLWDWSRKVMVGKEALVPNITRITVNPKDNHIVSTSGNNHWKVWRVEEGSFKEQPLYSKLSQNQYFTDHDWVDAETLIAITDMNEAFVARGQQILQYIEFSFGKDAEHNVIAAGATCVLSTSKGFIVASEEGHLALWEAVDEARHDEEEEPGPFRHVKTWHCGKEAANRSAGLVAEQRNTGDCFEI